MIKFLRNYKLRVQVDSSTGPYIEITNPLTLDFTIQKANYASLATAIFQIKNLGDVTRKRIYWDYFAFTNRPHIEFFAGYGTSQPLLYRGTIVEASSTRMGGAVDNITQVASNIGSVSTVSNLIAVTLQAPISQKDVIRALIKALSPLQEGFISDEFNIIHTRPVTLFGNAWNLLLQETGGYCFIDDGKIVCMKNGDRISTDIFVLNASTGLLGSPKRTKAFVTAEMLFEPRIIVGQQVQLESTDNSYLNSVYTVYGIEHTGTISDAIGGQCRTKISMLIGDNPLFPSRGVVASGLAI